jgi:hypothetical protein
MQGEDLNVIDVAFKAVREFGFPTFIIAILGYWIHKAAGAMHTTVVLPIVKSHTEFMSVTQETLQGVGETQKKQTDMLHEISGNQKEIVAAFKALGQPQERS